MGLLDRDYMHKRPPLKFPEPWSNPVARWWRRTSLTTILTTGILMVSLASAAVWFLRDIDLFSSREGSLLVNVNTATLDELESIPGIGPSIAAAIVANRPYQDVAELERVRGIGPETIQSIRPYVKTEGETETLR